MSGRRRSSQLIFRRRMAVVRMLLQRSMSEAEIIAAVQAELGSDTYPASDTHAWKHDLSILRKEFGVEIELAYDPQMRLNRYELRHLGCLALLITSPEEQSMLLRLQRATTTPSLLTHLMDRIDLLRYRPSTIVELEEAA